jgi:hypothetical protein
MYILPIIIFTKYTTRRTYSWCHRYSTSSPSSSPENLSKEVQVVCGNFLNVTHSLLC